MIPENVNLIYTCSLHHPGSRNFMFLQGNEEIVTALEHATVISMYETYTLITIAPFSTNSRLVIYRTDGLDQI